MLKYAEYINEFPMEFIYIFPMARMIFARLYNHIIYII